jgi:hypothetical protein
MKELIKIIQTENKSNLFYMLDYTTMKDIEFVLYRNEYSHTISNPILYSTYDFKEVQGAIAICIEMGIKRSK